MSDLLQEAMVARDGGEIKRSKQLISQALIQEPRNEAAWMMMADVVEDVRLKRNCLERVLAINPNNTAASTMLTKLNTSPLSPVTRGERDKPIDPPAIEKIPPFTPPFTWEGEQEQFIALGDMTYPNLPIEEEAKPPQETPTFDWAHDSGEPDKTINKIFDSVSNPELTTQALPDNTDIPWIDKDQQEEDSDNVVEHATEYADAWSAEAAIPAESDQVDQPAITSEDFSVSPEPQFGLEAFTTREQSLEAVTSDYRLWDNPSGKKDRMIILSNKTLIYANPKPDDVPQILGLFAENKMLRELLGENAGVIKLENIRCLTANPRKRNLSIEYKNKENRIVTHEITLSSPEVLDEVLEALLVRLGPDFVQSSHTFSLADKIIPPLVTLLFIYFLGWGLLAGLPLLGRLSGSQVGNLQVVINSIQSFVAFVGDSTILLVAIIFGLLTLIWLSSNLGQPSKLIIFNRRKL